MGDRLRLLLRLPLRARVFASGEQPTKLLRLLSRLGERDGRVGTERDGIALAGKPIREPPAPDELRGVFPRAMIPDLTDNPGRASLPTAGLIPGPVGWLLAMETQIPDRWGPALRGAIWGAAPFIFFMAAVIEGVIAGNYLVATVCTVLFFASIALVVYWDRLVPLRIRAESHLSLSYLSQRIPASARQS